MCHGLITLKKNERNSNEMKKKSNMLVLGCSKKKTWKHGSMARAGHGLPKVSPCEWPPPKQPYSSFMGGHLQGEGPTAIFYPLGQPRLDATA
jgi:hypothetical protein